MVVPFRVHLRHFSRFEVFDGDAHALAAAFAEDEADVALDLGSLPACHNPALPFAGHGRAQVRIRAQLPVFKSHAVAVAHHQPAVCVYRSQGSCALRRRIGREHAAAGGVHSKWKQLGLYNPAFVNRKLGRRQRRNKKGEAFQQLVADVARVFTPLAKVEVGKWVQGPDGRRELDVTVKGMINGKDIFILVECKDYTYSSTPTPVGIGDVDAFESKRRDLAADFAVMASNSGFTGPALKKAARTRIDA